MILNYKNETWLNYKLNYYKIKQSTSSEDK